MKKIKKFGTFGGVFTPSILTILGVIMYLRFPSILGQMGLINTLGIIVIAHIISFSTSLSVASLSTDKTVKTGGTYFMISRSLGLPIGGTLGLALFVGFSFSVSLYLIGFSESFLSYWNMDTSINSMRIAGTIVLIIVTIITFISASLAIKSQYIIMAIIVLSLLSIFLGNHDFAPEQINLKPMADAMPFMVLFGIFFPAVTGFEAGVSMSGDLKDPKKSLPLGAMSAVAVGFVIYVVLAIYLTYTVDSEALKSDSEILFKISLVPGLVIAGIWGATLSSALGGVLGAPRILQAMAMDKIVPKIFAKGTGKANEPRNALLVAFVIAEAGILIGELDVIARIVSMFFITTYAFLNLASAIESWSSSDFRPEFRTPRIVSVIGAVAAFIVMILLDFLALAGAVVVLGMLFFYLKRKELVLESGDAWNSFWTNLAKHSLLKLTKEKTDKRNWRPNIILFSGGEQARPHLIEMGLVMSGKLGVLTDFELMFSPNSGVPFEVSKNLQKTKTGANFFKRQFECDSVENGIKSVTNVYGFSGFEPNTIMMGWSKDTGNGKFLVNVLTDFKKKNLNAVFLDYDKESGFGKKENIDIWWNGKGHFLSFALHLMRFILSDPDWRDANLRILIINNDNTLTDRLYRNVLALLEEKRIRAKVKIISDDFGTRSKEVIINSESANADLVVLGISPNSNKYTEKYIHSISHISDLKASLLILSPSEEFEEINLIDSIIKRNTLEIPESVLQELKPIPQVESVILKNRIEKLDEDLQNLTNSFFEETIRDAVNAQIGFVQNFKEFTSVNINKLEKALNENAEDQLYKATNKLHHTFLNFSSNFFDTQREKAIVQIKEMLSNGISMFKLKLGNYIYESPETILIPMIRTFSKKEKLVTIQYKRLLNYSINHNLISEFTEQLLVFENHTFKQYNDLKNIILQVNDLYEKIRLDNYSNKLELQNHKLQINKDFTELLQDLKNQIIECKSHLLNTARNQAIEIGTDLLNPDAKKIIRKKIKSKQINSIESIEFIPEEWELNVHLLNNSVLLDCYVLSEQKIINGIIYNYNDKISSITTDCVFSPINAILQNIEKSIANHTNEIKDISFTDKVALRGLFQETFSKVSEIIDKMPQEIEISNFSYDENNLKNLPENCSPLLVEPYKIARYYLDTRFYEPFYRELEQLEALIIQTIEDCREANSLIKFRMDNAIDDIENNLLTKLDISNFLNSTNHQIVQYKLNLEEAIERIKFKSDEMIKNALSPLYSHAIIQAEQTISALLRGQKGRKFGVGISLKIKTFIKKINALIVRSLYSSSEGMILAKKYLNKIDDSRTSIKQILDVSDKVSPNPNMLSQIPVFYRTLFTSKSLINDDFWMPMEEDLKAIKKAIQWHKNGRGGAILITG
ncbi:MAG: amino acid permease, partial [Bacteroidales bacterium]|nr:amino acid permease [Bacteroidales bacterium]